MRYSPFDFQGFVDRGSLSAGFGEILLAESTRMFKWWGHVREGAKDRTWFQRKMRKVRRLVGGALLGGTTCGDPKTEGTVTGNQQVWAAPAGASRRRIW